MEENSEDRLLDHEYDGIREYDNPMPRWWLWMFYASILFVPFYYLAPGWMGEGPGMIAEYDAEVAAHAASGSAAAGGPVSDAAIISLIGRADVIAEGRTVFAQYCAVCHRADGGGLIGPNLTDDAWLHGDAPSAIRNSVSEGVLAKGMPAWDRLLKPAQVDAVTAFIISMKGSTPADPKAPEGTVTPPAGP